MPLRIQHIALGIAAASLAVPAHAAIPQLDPTWFASQLFWLAISFAFMILLVRLAIAPSVDAILDSRKASITAAIRDAEIARLQASQANADMTATVNDARSNAALMLADIKKQASIRTAESLQALDQELKAKLLKAEANIADAKASAMNDLHAQSALLTQAIVEKIIGVPVTQQDALNITRKVS